MHGCAWLTLDSPRSHLEARRLEASRRAVSRPAAPHSGKSSAAARRLRRTDTARPARCCPAIAFVRGCGRRHGPPHHAGRLLRQPDWLIDRERLRDRFPPRVRARELWRVDPTYLEEAHDDATLLAIRDQERAGIDILTDGEMRRESYSNRFATALEGVDIDNPAPPRPQRPSQPGPAGGGAGLAARAGAGARPRVPEGEHGRPVKMTVPGPFTMSQQAQNDFYDSDEELALAYAAAINEEIAGPGRRGRGHRADRRALPPGPAGGGAALRRAASSTARSRGWR